MGTDADEKSALGTISEQLKSIEKIMGIEFSAMRDRIKSGDEKSSASIALVAEQITGLRRSFEELQRITSEHPGYADKVANQLGLRLEKELLALHTRVEKDTVTHRETHTVLFTKTDGLSTQVNRLYGGLALAAAVGVTNIIAYFNQ